MTSRRASFFTLLLLLGCGPVPSVAEFAVAPVVRTACGFAPQVPASIKQGSTTRIELQPTRSDITFRVVTVPAATEAELDGDTLVYRAGYETLGAQAVVELEVTCEGKTQTAAIRLPVEQSLRWGTALTWAPNDGPEAREHALLFIDPRDADTLWLFGGFGFVPAQFTVINDLWKMNLVTGAWTKVETTGAPMIAGARLAPSATPGVWYLLGGQAQGQDVLNDLWRLDLTQRPVHFEKVTPNGTSPTTTLHTVVIDAARNRLVSFGGFTGNAVSNDVDTLTLTEPMTWERQPAQPTRPAPRYGFFAAVDQEQLIVFSGAQWPSASNPVNPIGDTWAMNLSTLTWTKVAEPTDDAPARRNGCSALDPVRHRFFVFGGTPNASSSVPGLSMLDLSTQKAQWHRVSLANPAPVRSSCSGIYDAARRRMLFGFGNDSGVFADFQVLQLD